MEEKWRNPCSEVKELILVKLVYGGLRSHYHVVDLKAGKLGMTPVATLLNEGGESDPVQLGSSIYSLGGKTCVDPDYVDSFRNLDHHIHLGASCLDFISKSHLLSFLENCDDDDVLLNSKSIRWKEVPIVVDRPSLYSCASLDDKIYAFQHTESNLGIGKEFMPQCGQWKPLPQPPDDFPLPFYCVSSPVIPDEKNGRLLVHLSSANALYAYYPEQRAWNCLDPKFHRWECASALFDGVLYKHTQGKLNCLRAYDVSNKSWLKVVYSSPIPLQVCKCEFVDMLHLGNDILCLATWIPSIEGAKLLHFNLLFFKFTVKRTSLTDVLVTPGDFCSFPFDKARMIIATRFFAL